MNEVKRNKTIAAAMNAIDATLGEVDFKHYLEMVYDIAYYSGKMQYSRRKEVEQLKDGIVVFTYPSITHAAKVAGVHKSSISKNIRDGSITRTGSTYRFKQY